jgi:hypothetical protein
MHSEVSKLPMSRAPARELESSRAAIELDGADVASMTLLELARSLRQKVLVSIPYGLYNPVWDGDWGISAKRGCRPTQRFDRTRSSTAIILRRRLNG